MTAPQSYPVWLPPPPQRPRPQPCNHVLHLLLTLITFGLWAPIWLIIGISCHSMNRGAEENYQRRLHEYNQAMWAAYGPGPRP